LKDRATVLCVRKTAFCWSPGKGHDGHYRAEEFVGAKRPMKLRCVNRKKKRRSALTR
jgi:hypothetical protein